MQFFFLQFANLFNDDLVRSDCSFQTEPLSHENKLFVTTRFQNNELNNVILISMYKKMRAKQFSASVLLKRESESSGSTPTRCTFVLFSWWAWCHVIVTRLTSSRVSWPYFHFILLFEVNVSVCVNLHHLCCSVWLYCLWWVEVQYCPFWGTWKNILFIKKFQFLQSE